MNFYKLIKPLVFQLNAEAAHELAQKILAAGILPKKKIISDPVLSQKVFGIDFINPVGMAAGFDKNAKVIAPLFDQGFAFVEAGTVTPKPQEGNEKPRLFRLEQDEAIINRLGFNNKGIENFKINLLLWKWKKSDYPGRVLGINIGKNKTTEDALSDYILLLNETYEQADYITVNISSPNTPGLRNLQQGDEFKNLMQNLMLERRKFKIKKPILVKIAPDLDIDAIRTIADSCLELNVDGVIISNTTISRPELSSKNSGEMGGLSGKPLFELSTKTLSLFYQFSSGKIPIIGVGGISNAAEAYKKIRAGASLIQIYSSLIYKGFGLVNEINTGLAEMIKNDGFSNISEVIGVDSKKK